MGDFAAEWLAFFVPVIAAWLGYGSVFSEEMFAVWILDFIFAFALGMRLHHQLSRQLVAVARWHKTGNAAHGPLFHLSV